MLVVPEFEALTELELDDMAWTTPQYSRRKVDVAGAHLAERFSSLAERYNVYPNAKGESDMDGFFAEYDNAFTIINNWRASHSYPLQIIKMALWRRAKSVDPNAIIAQRLKRLSSVAQKLRRNSHMKLSQMQDIGGCRAVLHNVGMVDRLVDIYEETVAKNPHGRPERIEEYDYIDDPKPDGYRSIHYVYKYRSLSPRHECFNGLRIEIQLRSQLQHAWATAVETVSTFTGQALKSNVGDESWKRFFALMGSAIALREHRPTVARTPVNRLELTDELRRLFLQLRVEQVLDAWSFAVHITETNETYVGAQTYLLVLDAGKKTIEVKPFQKDQLTEANEAYLKVEKQNSDNPDVQAVLVSVDSLAALRSAYPNYYLDTSEFLKAVRLAIQ